MHIIQPVGKNPSGDEYEFTHGVDQKAWYGEIPVEERRHLHLDAVNAIIDRADEDIEDYQEIAQHYQSVGERANAFKFWYLAGEQARKRQLPDLVYRAFRQALHLCEELGVNCSLEDLFLLLQNWSDYAFDLDDVETCKLLYTNGLQEGYKRNNQRLLAFGESGMAWVESLKGNHILAMELISSAENRLDPGKDRDYLARVSVIKGIILIRNGEYSEALESLHQEGILFHSGRRDQFLELMARIAPYLVLAHCEVGKISEAKRLANSIGELINSTQNRNLAIELEIALVLVYLGVKDYQAAENLISTIKPKLEGFNIQWWVMNLRLSEARVTLEQGNLQTSWKLIAELINEFESDERYKPGIAFAFYLKGEIFRHLGDFIAARNFFESGITCTNNQFFQFRNAIPLSVVEYLSGEKEISFTILNSVLADIQAKNYQLLEVTARFTYLLFLAERLERETFFSEYLLLQQHIVDLGEPLMVADMLYLEGVKAVRFGDLYEGLKKLKEGYEAAKKAGDFWTQLMCLRGYIHDSPLPNSCAEERKIFGQLLEQLKGKYDSVELETKVRKYISTQKKSIKE